MKQRRPPVPGIGWLALAALPLVLLWPLPRHIFESRMSVHMLGEFPMLFLAGWAVWRVCRARSRWLIDCLGIFNWRGWTGATWATGVALVWMLPSALDAALLSPGLGAVKIASWWLAGWLLADSWHRMDAEVLLFFVGNLAWMMATAGLLYIDAPVRLCVNYLEDDQRHAGIGLVLLAGLLGALALRRALSPAAAPA